MNPQEYISSGILESYVLGLASEEETREVQKMMETYPEVKREVEAIEASLMEHASLQANVPSDELRKKIIAEVTGEVPRIITMNNVEERKSFFYKYGAAASLILLLASAGLNFYLYRNLKEAKNQVAILNQEKEQMATVFQAEKARYEDELTAVSSPESHAVILKGSTLSPASLATVFWNHESHEVYINVNALPPPPQGKQYQLWALANGQPVDAGVFSLGDTTGLQKMKNISDAQAFAVTLEDAGGSPVPTLVAMYLSGNI